MLAQTSETFSVTSLCGDWRALRALESEWRALCAEQPAPEPFYTPEWICGYFEAFEPKARVRLFLVRDAHGKLAALLPLIEEQVIYLGLAARRLRAPANVHSCRFDVVCGAADRSAIAAALWAALRDSREWDVIELSDVPEGGIFDEVMLLAARQGCPIGKWLSLRTPQLSLEPGTDLESCLGPEHKEFRSKLRKKRRKLEKAAKVELRRVTELDEALLKRFFDLEAAGWKGRGGTAIANDADTRTFYERLAREAASRGNLCMYALSADGKEIAIHFGFRMGQGYFLPKITFDESWGEYSPGQLTFEDVISRCKSDGLKLFDFLGPTAQWKERWCSSHLNHWNCSIFTNTLAGHVMHFEKYFVMKSLRDLKHRIKGTQPG